MAASKMVGLAPKAAWSPPYVGTPLPTSQSLNGRAMKKTSLQTVDGPTKELFADGTVSGEGKMKSGKRHGKWKFYLRNGQTKAVGKYAAGELDGYWEWWRENGQPLQAGAFANRVQVGPWKRYYENGQLWDEGEYQDGKKFGEWTTYDKSGGVKQRKTFKPK